MFYTVHIQRPGMPGYNELLAQVQFGLYDREGALMAVFIGPYAERNANKVKLLLERAP